MDDDLGAAEDERTIELSSIAAIYPELIIDSSDPYSATLDIPVTPEKPLKIYFQASATTAPPTLPTPPTSVVREDNTDASRVPLQAAAIDTHSLSHLPPLRISITLPADYPTTESPKVHLSSVPSWIPKDTITKLETDCGRLWEELGKDQVVYTYIDHLQQAAENGFDLARSDDARFKLSGDLKLALLDYDLKSKRERFEKETFDCGICLEPKKGLQCHRLLLCGHVFCVACLQDFYNSCISEGDVDSVKCLDPDCGKNIEQFSTPGKRRKLDRTLNPSELLQIPLEQETVQRYVRLKRKKKLESDKNTVYCPRQWCQGAAKSNKHPKPDDPLNDGVDFESDPEQEASGEQKGSDPEKVPMGERLSVCEDCNFAFCSVCKKGWHGEFIQARLCNPRRQAELNAEEKATEDYLLRYSTPCPTCDAPSQKTHGCNHMICFKCKTHFCYLCSAFLMPDNPYRHFNDQNSRCYMRLWELEEGDGVDAPGAGRLPWQDQLPDWDTESDISDDEGQPAFLPAEDFILIGDDDDSEDERPAPDQRRPERAMHIEIVNFAANGAQRRFELPERPREAPPQVPDPPPRRRGGGQQGNRQRQMQNEPFRQPAVRADGQLIRDDPIIPELRNLPPAAPGQGNGVQLPAGVRNMGLERFLELAQQDLEDEWDSDELDDDDILMPMPIAAPAPRPPQQNAPRRRGGGGGRGGR